MFGKYERVLIVDDCEFQRRTLSKDLRAHGYTVQTASDGVEALRVISEQQFDFVITDWDMPNLNGAVLCRCLRSELKSDRYIYIIMMTSKADTSDVVDSFTAGVDDFITKPINIQELLARMQAGNRVLGHDRRLAYVAERDPLTGLLNRRSLTPRLTAAVAEVQRFGHPLSCILLDLDHFKQINDSYGHACGDDTLVAVADCLVKSFRTGDAVFRYGGEEFLVLLPATDASSANLCAERCREAIGNLDFAPIGVSEKITASFGVSELKRGEHSIMELLERADGGLLQAKKKGRNCTVFLPLADMPSLPTGTLPAQA